MSSRKIKLTHPGKILREEFMEPLGLSAYALAKALRVPLPRVNDIVRESARSLRRWQCPSLAPTITSSIWRRIPMGIVGSGAVEFPSNSWSYKWGTRHSLRSHPVSLR